MTGACGAEYGRGCGREGTPRGRSGGPRCARLACARSSKPEPQPEHRARPADGARPATSASKSRYLANLAAPPPTRTPSRLRIPSGHMALTPYTPTPPAHGSRPRPGRGGTLNGRGKKRRTSADTDRDRAHARVPGSIWCPPGRARTRNSRPQGGRKEPLPLLARRRASPPSETSAPPAPHASGAVTGRRPRARVASRDTARGVRRARAVHATG